MGCADGCHGVPLRATAAGHVAEVVEACAFASRLVQLGVASCMSAWYSEFCSNENLCMACNLTQSNIFIMSLCTLISDLF